MLQYQSDTSWRAALFYCGFLLLPWMWCVNVWLFWPDFRHGDDAVVLRCVHLALGLRAVCVSFWDVLALYHTPSSYVGDPVPASLSNCEADGLVCWELSRHAAVSSMFCCCVGSPSSLAAHLQHRCALLQGRSVWR